MRTRFTLKNKKLPGEESRDNDFWLSKWELIFKDRKNALTALLLSKEEVTQPSLFDCLYLWELRILELVSQKCKKTIFPYVKQYRSIHTVPRQLLVEKPNRSQWRPLGWDAWDSKKWCMWSDSELFAFDQLVGRKDIKNTTKEALHVLDHFPKQLMDVKRSKEKGNTYFGSISIPNQMLFLGLIIFFIKVASTLIMSEGEENYVIGIILVSQACRIIWHIYNYNMHIQLEEIAEKSMKEINLLPVPGFERLPKLNFRESALKDSNTRKQNHRLIASKLAFFEDIKSWIKRIDALPLSEHDQAQVTFMSILFSKDCQILFQKKSLLSDTSEFLKKWRQANQGDSSEERLNHSSLAHHASSESTEEAKNTSSSSGEQQREEDYMRIVAEHRLAGRHVEADDMMAKWEKECISQEELQLLDQRLEDLFPGLAKEQGESMQSATQGLLPLEETFSLDSQGGRRTRTAKAIYGTNIASF